MTSKPGGKSGTRAPEHTFEEVKYLKHLIENQTPVRVQLSNNEEVERHRRVLRRLLHSHHAHGRAQSVHLQTRHQVSDRGGRRNRPMPSYLETAVEIAREAGASAGQLLRPAHSVRTERRFRPGDRGRPRLRAPDRRAAALAFSLARHRGRGRRRARKRVGIPLVRRSARRHHQFRARVSLFQRDAGAGDRRAS